MWYRIHVFVFDLRHFKEKVDSQKRLDKIMDASYLGTPYFETEEVEQLKSTIVTDGDKTLQELIQETLNERLNRRMKKRVESEDYRVCAAHDLAPIFEKAFAINPKDLAKSQEFLALVEASGLKGGENWAGLKKRTFQPKSQKKKGKNTR